MPRPEDWARARRRNANGNRRDGGCRKLRSSPCSAVSCLQQIAMSRSLPSYAEGLRTEIHLRRTRAARCGHRAPELFNELPGSFKTPFPTVPNIPELHGADPAGVSLDYASVRPTLRKKQFPDVLS